MLWLTWRRHRWLLLTGALFLLAFCLVFLNNGILLYRIYNQLDLATCRINVTLCNDKIEASSLKLSTPLWILENLKSLPLLIGVFVGAPLLPGEQRTASFMRTQGATLRRWLTVKIGIITLTTLLFTAILALVVAWWTAPLFSAYLLGIGPAGSGGGNWNYYESMGIVLIGKVLFALLLSILIGALIQRTLPAMVVTFFLMAALIIGSYAIYPYILPPTTSRFPITLNGTGGIKQPAEVIARDNLAIADDFVDSNGQKITFNQINALCSTSSNSSDSQADLLAQCSKDKHLQSESIYQPGKNYWPMQIIETIVLLILSLCLLPIIYTVSRKQLH